MKCLEKLGSHNEVCCFNPGINCNVKIEDYCYFCGWNPDVDERRKQRIENGEMIPAESAHLKGTKYLKLR